MLRRVPSVLSPAVDAESVEMSDDETAGLEQEEVLQDEPALVRIVSRPRQHRSASIVSLEQPDVAAFSAATGLFDPPARHPLDPEHDELPEEARSVSPAPEEELVEEDRTGLPTFDESQAHFYASVERPQQTLQIPQSAGLMRRSTSGASSNGTFLSVANSPLARLSAEASTSTPNPNRRSFLANLLSPRPKTPVPPVSPARGHIRNGSSPLPSPAPSSLTTPAHVRRTASVHGDSPGSTPLGLSFATSPVDGTDGVPEEPPMKPFTELTELGLRIDALTSSLSLSRNSQPLCGTVLDGKYLLLGTTSGLEFLPFLQRPDIKRPISLLKRVRFKSIAVLKDRSNIMLAVAGRNDHVRVYALDGIRTIIDKKMKDLSTPSLARALVNVAHGQSPALSLYPPQTETPSSAGTPGSSNINKGKFKEKPKPLSLQRDSPTAIATQGPPLSPPPLYQTTSGPSSRPGPSKQRSRATINGTATSLNLQTTQSRETVRSLSKRDSTTSRRASTRRHTQGYQADNTSTDSLAEHLLAADQREVPPEESSGDSAIAERRRLSPRSARALSDPNPGAPGLTLAQALLAEHKLLEDNKENAPPLLKPKRSGLMARGAARERDSMADLAAFLKEGPPQDGMTPKRRRITLDEDAQDFPPIVNSPSLADEFTEEPESLTTSGVSDDLPRITTGGTTTLEPPNSSSSRSSHSPSAPTANRLTPRAASVALFDDGSLRELANFFRQSAPTPQNNTDGARTRRHSTSAAPNLTSNENRGASERDDLPAPVPDITARQRKRWSVLDGLRGPLSSNGTASPSPPVASGSGSNNAAVRTEELEAALANFPLRSRNLETTTMAIVDANLHLSEESRHSSSNVSRTSVDAERPVPRSADVKRPPSPVNRLLPDVLPDLQERSPADRHPANAAAPLDYVKLARTKGTRLLRCIETKKRTYLAVLCGEAGERIELFTGSRNVSLSLNRTFVLPETPRTIELQLQGDELVDIYLVYDESVFALEPSTVRVREVGITRNERRAARRERDRMRLSSDAPLPPVPVSDPSPGSPATPISPVTTAIVGSGSGALTPVSQLAKDQPPFVTFQQLQFIPPVPPSVLASAYLIPPLYTSVVGQNASGPSQPPPATPQGGLPPLSPISLLANHPARNSGPPGLFFVTRGRSTTNIVDGDGRSVIKKPFVWTTDPMFKMDSTTPEQIKAALSINRIDLMLTEQGTRTVLVAFGMTDVRAMEVGPNQSTVEVVPTETVKRRAKLVDPWEMMREVVHLGSTESRCIWAERAGNHYCVHQLSVV